MWQVRDNGVICDKSKEKCIYNKIKWFQENKYRFLSEIIIKNSTLCGISSETSDKSSILLNPYNFYGF